jgi:hypothetical protein
MPVVVIPAPNTITKNNVPLFTGTSDPGTEVNVVEGATLLCAAAVDSQGVWSCTSTVMLTDGVYQVSVAEVNKIGDMSMPAEIEFTVDTTAPTVHLNTSDGMRISGSADPRALVNITDALGKPVAGCQRVTADVHGAFSCVPATPLVSGDVVTASVTDKAGNRSTATVTIAVCMAVSKVSVKVLAPTGGVVFEGSNLWLVWLSVDILAAMVLAAMRLCLRVRCRA